MKPILLYICSLLFPYICTISAQHNNDIDTSSVKKRLTYQLHESLNQTNFENALKITDSLVEYGIQNNDSLFIGYAYSAKATIYRFKQDLSTAKMHLKKSIKIYKKYRRYSHLVELNTQLANTLRAEGKLDSCFYVLNTKTQQYISDSTSKSSLRYFYNAKEVAYSNIGRIDSAVYYIFKRIAIVDTNDYYRLGTPHSTLARNFYKVNDLQKALIHTDKALDYFAKTSYNVDRTICQTYILKASILLKLKRYKEVASYISKTQGLLKKKDVPRYRIQIEILSAKLYWETKQFEKIPSLNTNQIENEEIPNHTLFDLYLTKLTQDITFKNWKEADIHLKKLNILIATISDLHLKQSFYKLSSIYWVETRDFKKGYEAQHKYLETKEKITTQQQTYMAYDLDQKYQVTKKNKEIIQQNLTIQKQENQLLKTEKHQTYLTLSIVSAILGFFSLLFIYQQRQKIKNNEILVLQRQQEIVKLESLINGEEKERNRIAQDLHDGLNGDLAVIKYKITSLPSFTLNDTEKTIHKETIEMLDNTVEQVRRISHNLSPASLQNFDLIEAIQQFCNTTNNTNPLHINFQYFGNQLILEKEKETAIYRIIQELVHNIIKHANASEALVQINKHEDFVNIIIEDNGNGFDLSAKSNGIGLQNVRSRINFLNANLDIVSNQNGSTFTIVLDLNKIYKA
ncbi:sensor histidine kinase [Aquimarina sp. AD10]|uniref:sensor histidine kinase n=2 Tax=Aquimarina sp. AD10 TaxID=1714849 RepID=UPI000EA95284|nr:sensor histidine kinase [Aquimarina sp. AD10]RKN01186.1 sensor histidine kinase [Aquimarina sp. AD10]